MTEPNNQVSTGSAVGVGVLCWFIAGAVCAIGTWAITSMLFGAAGSGSSTGGLLGIICGIVCGVRYKGNGDMGKTIGLAVILGVVLCVLVIFISYMMARSGIYR